MIDLQIIPIQTIVYMLRRFKRVSAADVLVVSRNPSSCMVASEISHSGITEGETMSRSPVIALMLAMSLFFAGCGDTDSHSGTIPPIGKVGEWFVGFATGAGRYVVEKANTFAEAVQRAWTAFWGPDKVNGVVVNDEDPLRGVFDGVLKCEVGWGTSGAKQAENKMSVELDRPKMIRSSAESTEWQLAPEEKKRISELQNLLLEVS